MQAYDVIVWDDNNVSRYIKTLEHSLETIRRAFSDLEVEILTTQEQIDNLRNGKRGETLQYHLQTFYHRGLDVLELPHEHIGRKGKM